MMLRNVGLACEVVSDCNSEACVCKIGPFGKTRFCVETSVYERMRGDCDTCFSSTASSICTGESRRAVYAACEINVLDESAKACFRSATSNNNSPSSESSSVSNPSPEASKNSGENAGKHGQSWAYNIEDGLGVGAIIGIVIGSIIGAVLIVVIGVVGARKWKTRNRVF